MIVITLDQPVMQAGPVKRPGLVIVVVDLLLELPQIENTVVLGAFLSTVSRVGTRKNGHANLVHRDAR
jgi:hypothetical protein